MPVAVVVLNGGSSAGKSSITRCLQDLLGPPWLRLGIDDLLRALPAADDLRGAPDSIAICGDGSIAVSDAFRPVEAAWYEGLAAMARAGARLIVEEVLLEASVSQGRLAAALSGLEVFWVGVHCDADVAAARELARGDRVVGMARRQARVVHEGIAYDLVVDTTTRTAAECAAAIAGRLHDAASDVNASPSPKA